MTHGAAKVARGHVAVDTRCCGRRNSWHLTGLMFRPPTAEARAGSNFQRGEIGRSAPAGTRNINSYVVGDATVSMTSTRSASATASDTSWVTRIAVNA